VSEEYNLNKMVAETHSIDRSRVEKVKRNLFGTPTEDEKKLFHSEYEKTINEERKVNSEYHFYSTRQGIREPQNTATSIIIISKFIC